jgi:hypothetical protein
MANYTFPRNLQNHRAMMRISIHQRQNEISDISRQMHSTETVLSRIYLYMPTSIQISDGLTFENVNLSSALGMGIDAMGVVMNGGDTSGVTDTIQAGVLQGVANGGGGLVAGAAAQALIQEGRVTNPRTQLLFKGPILRQFSFAHKLIPSNRAEAEDIYQMIKTIRKHSYPISDGMSSESESMFQFPDVFRVEMVSSTGGGRLKMSKIADTYCTAITTNYNPTSNAFYAGGYPSEIDIAMTFQETKTLSRADIEQGF